ncbi:hypothetical protein DPMN_146819 [Dreissena polymorpha]|uniref:Uncharacterized protein n=1 Tax=Dreissena polymorpha TaxID=45954 RepID=A0A9D4J2Q9_DREPO|nr:hypothetical protein DPMN_146819 [Dreissena polymorpha]
MALKSHVIHQSVVPSAASPGQQHLAQQGDKDVWGRLLQTSPCQRLLNQHHLIWGG